MLNHKFLLRCSFLYLLTSFFSLSFANTPAPWAEEFFEYIEKSDGKTVTQRARRLESLILREARRPVEEKLAEVNEFFNDVQWVSDLLHWGKKDYWQTPLETLTKFKGDCEDIAIAKYAALRVMGVPDKKLALVYVKKKKDGVPHMVLAYYQSKDVAPIILDNLNKSTMKASDRKDLIPVYGFNSTTLWLTDTHMRKRGKGMPVPPSHRLVPL